MLSALNISLSGLNAVSKRAASTADNVANIRSIAVPATDGADSQGDATRGRRFQPLTVGQRSVATGGTRAHTEAVEPASARRFEPDSPDANSEGIAHRPNVTPEVEFGELLRAQRAYAASIEVAEEANRALSALSNPDKV